MACRRVCQAARGAAGGATAIGLVYSEVRSLSTLEVCGNPIDGPTIISQDYCWSL